jgi:serine/threonine protein phosphatase PrpC
MNASAGAPPPRGDDPPLRLPGGRPPEPLASDRRYPPSPAEPAVTCPSCGRVAGPDDNFCEACRTALAPSVASDGASGPAGQCPYCAGRIGGDAYCESCGRKRPASRDHIELDLGLVAGITDRGLRHRRNEDAMVLATAQRPGGPVVVAVVCDGVSTADRPDEASLAAVQAAGDVLLAAARGGEDPAAASAEAVRAAQLALARLAGLVDDRPTEDLPVTRPVGDAPTEDLPTVDPPTEGPPTEDPPTEDLPTVDPPADRLTATDGDRSRGAPDGSPAADGGNAPAATFVSAVLTGDAATLCWLGDSRAYWLGADGSGAQRLTRDDSLAEELVAAGLLDASEALASPQAHVVTRWVGADLAGEAAHVIRFEPPGSGVLLLCSDGLWNYAPDAADLAARALPRALTDPLGAAASLVAFALSAGGHDNVTVVLVPFPPLRQAEGGSGGSSPRANTARTATIPT